MPEFCSQNKEEITSTNYKNSYSSSCLPNNGTGFSSVGVSDDTVYTYVIGTLLPDTNITPANIQDEYCFYYKRYMFALSQVLKLASTTGTDLTTGSTYDTYKQHAIRLNTMLTQILQVLKVITSNQPEYDVYSAHMNIEKHMRKLKDKDMESDVKSAMIDYTLEKNSSSRNLLAIYGFMNLVAVGMLVYLYRNAK